MSNEYDALVSASLQPEPAQAARAGFAAATDTNPDAYAEAKRVAARTGVPVDTVFAMPNEIKRQDAIGSIDFDAMAKTSPSTAALLADVEKAKVSHDDTESLSGFEQAANSLKAWQGPKASFSSVATGLAKSLPQGAELARQGLRQQFADLFGFDDMGADARRKFAQAQSAVGLSTPAFESSTASGIYSGGSSLLRQIPGLAASILTRSTAPMLATAGIQTEAEAYGKYTARGATPGMAALGAAAESGIEVATELLPMGFLLDNLGKVGMGKFITGLLAREIPGEQLATLGQDAVDTAIANPDKTWGDYVKERPDAAYQTLLATITQTGVMSAAISIANRGQQKQQDAQQAVFDGEKLAEMAMHASASNLLKRDTVTAQGFFQSVLDEGRDSVYISADALAQSGLAERMAQLIPAVQEQLGTAAESGHDIRIPISDLMATMAGPELEQSILPHVAVEPGGFTPTTSQEYLQSDHAQELQAEVERVLGEKQGDDTFKASASAVKTTIKDQLTTAGRFTDSVNDAYSSMVGNFYAVQAARVGTTPEAMFERYPLKIGAESVAGQQFDQSGRLVTDTPAFKNWFGESKVVDESGKPMVVYHGTGQDFDSFEGWKNEFSITKGIYFSPHKDVANNFAQGEGGNVKPAYLTIKNPYLAKSYAEVAKLSDDRISQLKGQGFDGVYFKPNNPADYFQEEFVAFDPAQIKSATGNRGTFDPNDANILNQSAGPRMMAVHNLSADNLIFADKMGGLAVPSVGVVTEQAGSVDGFGEITLIGTQSLVDPAKERVFSSDAYTARFPKPEWPKAKTKDAQKLVNEIRETSNEFDDRSIIDYTWDNMTNTPDAGEVVIRWLQSNTIKAIYLREQGIDVQPVRVPVPQSTPVPAERLVELAPLVDAIDQSKDYEDTVASPEWAALSAAYKQIITEKYKSKGRSVTDTLTEFGYGTLAKLERDIKNAGKDQIDSWETSKQLGEQIDKQAVEFKQWVEAKVLPNFGDPFLTVGKKKSPYTLDNIVESMTDAKVRGKEKTMTYGPGQVRAAASIEFSDLEQMRKHAEGSVANTAEYDAAKEQAEKELSAYRDAVVNFTKITNWKGEPDIWEAMDGSMRALAKWATGKKRDAAALKSALRAEDFDVSKISDAAIQQGIVAGNALMNAPVPYFEAKPQRSVGLDEFAGAVIPKNAPQAVRDILAKHNIEVTEYAGEENRNEVAKEFAAQLNDQGKGTLFQNQPAPRGSFNPATLQLTLLKTADLSTFLHESGHFFLEVQADLAGQLQQEAAIHGADTLKPGEQKVLKDMQATLDWFGIKDLAEWNNLDFEEKRSYHEQFARGFESYLFEGKAPAIEMQGVFHRFRAWLLNVYKDLKALNIELTDEVRGVFDRMLATGEQIQLAEQGRSMMPLFTSAEQIGMTPDEFADYQALGTDATNEAIEELQARGLRDMQWIDNARGRIIKRLKQESKEKRAEVQMEVRAEVMRQPIYRAWSFLTGKLSVDDKIENQKPISSSPPSVLDETIDSLFVAIAKLGGLNKDEVVSTWGTDPADKPASGVFGKPVWRVEGGLSIDGMAEALSQYGYLPLDENGKVDLADFEAMFDAEVRGDPQYSNAYAPEQFIQPGDQVSNPGAVQAGRLAIESLDSMGLPVELVNHLKALRMTAKDGWHPDLVAERFGFESGEDMIRQIAVAETPKDEIESLTDQRMLERFGDLSSDDAIKKAADKAIHNEARARMLSTELNALEGALGKRKTLASAAKEYAAAMIARLKVGNIRPDIYASSAVRSGKASEKASRSGDIQTAAAEKRNQIISHFGTKAAHEAKAEVEALRRKWADLANRADDKLKKSYDMDLVNAVRAILGEYGIAEKKAKRAIDYLETVKTQDPEMYGIVSASIDAAAQNAKPFKEMTVEEVRGLGDEIDSILHLAKRVRQMEVDGDLIDRQEVEDALRGRVEEIGVPEAMPGDTSAITEGETRMVKFRTALAALTRVESWVGKMDGMAAFGPFRRFVYSRIKDSADAYRSDKAKYLKQFRDLFASIAPTMKPGLILAPELGYTFGKDNGGSAINELVHAILHTGNDSNMRKLLLGRNWAQERADGSLDTSRWDAFISRMANEGKITKAHFDFAQGVWDLLESTKPLAQKTHRDVFGKYFDEVTARPLKTPFGMYAGGYVPAQADARIVADANMRALAEAENQSMQFAFPTTSKGFTKGRVDYNKPLLLDLRTLAQHIDKVLLFSHMEMPVRDVQRVLSSVGGTLNKIDPVAIPAMLTPWLNRAAKQQVTTPITADAGLSRFLSVARSRAGAAAMFVNLANAVQQITGFSMAALKVRPSLMLFSTADFVKGPRDFVAAVSESSPYMADRLSSEVAAMSDDINQILLNPSLLEQGQAWTMKHAYFLQTAIDSCMSPIIWTAAYNQAVEQGMEHKDAVRLGDSAVRETQGSTLPEDISRIEAGPAWARLFTQFAGYFNMQANLLGTEFAKVMQEYGLKKGAGKGMYILTFGFLAPAIVGELIMQLFRGGPGDDDKDGEYLDDWLAALFFWAPLRNATAMLPGVGQLINSSVNAWNSKPYDDRIASSPAVSMVESAIKSPVSVYQAIANDGSPQKAVRDVATLISMSVGLPANLAARPIGYMAGMADDRIVPTSGADMARGLVTGMASPESKR